MISAVLELFEVTVLGLSAKQRQWPCRIKVVLVTVKRGLFIAEKSFEDRACDLGHACLAASIESIIPHKW